jgi:hypothetical protein
MGLCSSKKDVKVKADSHIGADSKVKSKKKTQEFSNLADGASSNT